MNSFVMLRQPYSIIRPSVIQFQILP